MIIFQLNLPGSLSIDEPADFKFKGGTVADVVSRALLFVFPIAGLILLGMLIFGGFTMMTSAGNPEQMQKGQGMVVNAIIGFVVIFVAYWIIQILQDVLGVGIY